MNHTPAGEFQFAGAFGGEVTLTFERDKAITPGYILLFPWYKGKLLLAKHVVRGWEVPGGTIEPGEMPIQAAIRETFEETGAELEAIEWIGQYQITGQRDELLVKSVYIARVSCMHPLPPEFETEAIRLCEEPPTPEQVRVDNSYSPIMQDGVYPLVLARIRDLQHPFAALNT